ncbi:hypothetical protein LTR84_006013 [Exophiala bonariae]|uniref:Uncharacterized protein n=1 Tax=Exophiala bonariae TaxID=1690606 RepID=A0AAV9N5H3_9EURO|nr:hypothetical protein LTR84_006013 [Exophiala bonariae]
MFPLFEKKFYWVEKDSKGRMFLYRKKGESYTYVKKVAKTREKDDYKSTCDCSKYHDQAYRYKHKADDRKLQEHVHHHYFHDKSTLCTTSKPKPNPKKCTQCLDPDPVILGQTSVCHSWCRTRSPSSSSSPAPKGKCQASPSIRHLHGNGVRVERSKVERYRPEREGDFDDFHDKYKQTHKDATKNHEQPRGRARDRCLARDDTVDDEPDDESYHSDCSHVCTGVCTDVHAAAPTHDRPAPLRDHTRRDREYERVTWDQDMGAWVAKRKPTVRFE